MPFGIGIVRLFANSRLPYAWAETKPTVAITTTANKAIANRRRKESADEGRSTRRGIVPTGAVKIRTPRPAVRRRSAERFRHARRASLHRQSQTAGEDEALDLARPFADLEDLGVAVEATHGCVVDVAVATVYLHRVAGRVDRDLGRVQLRHGRRVA